jgi:hypothetical protein
LNVVCTMKTPPYLFPYITKHKRAYATIRHSEIEKAL